MEPTPTGAEFESRLAELKEVKLKLPLRHHVSLHSLKLLRNRSISELVANALDAYFMKYSLVADHYQYIAILAVVGNWIPGMMP